MATQSELNAVCEEDRPLAGASAIKIAKVRTKLIRRADRDDSQLLRRSVQFAFLLLNIWLGSTFYFWVRRLETATGRTTIRPAGVEGWLPIAGLMNLKYWLVSGRVPATHPAAMFLLVCFLVISFFFRKAFCSWLCPVGTLSEYLWRAGRQIFGRTFRLPKWIDIPLRSLKYLLLGFFAWAVYNMTADAIEQFMHSPYGAVADVRMLNFFRNLSETAAVILALLVLASILLQNFWCRYLCPYGALLGLSSLLSPMRIRRSEPACIDCAKCAKACPAALPVDKLVSIKSAECTGCLECVAVCPAEGALQLALPAWNRAPRDRRVSPWFVAAGIVILFLGIVGYAKASGRWNGDVPDSIYRQLVVQPSDSGQP